MPTVSKKSGDAALGKDGTVKLNGKIVGVWWKDGDFDVFHTYHFALADGQEPVVSRMFRHHLKAAIGDYFNGTQNEAEHHPPLGRTRSSDS